MGFDQSKIDQGTAFVADNLPPFWRRLYRKTIEAGFTESEALKLVQTYILSQCPYGVRGVDG